MKQPKVIIKTFSESEMKKMIECLSGNDFLNMRNKTIMCLLFDIGIK